MSTTQPTYLSDVIAHHEDELLAEWLQEQREVLTRRRDLISDEAIERESRDFLALLRGGLADGSGDLGDAGWVPLRDYLAALSRSRAEAGFSPSETAIFVFSF